MTGPWFRTRRVGGIRFTKFGRLTVMYCVSRPAPHVEYACLGWFLVQSAPYLGAALAMFGVNL